MRSLLFKLIIVFMFALPVTAYADTEMYGTDLTLSGEDTYNEAVDKVSSGTLSLDPMSVLNMLTDDLLGEIRTIYSVRSGRARGM